jgi:Rrf2 family cysteine metabolism transcriptional repressor
MNLRKGTRYALYAAMEMARSVDGTPITSTLVAERYGISSAVLAKIFQQLVRAGLAAGTRGVRGGYTLTRPPTSVTVLDVIEAFEAPRALDRCLLADQDETACAHSDACRIRRLFDEVDEMARSTYASVTLDTLVGNRTARATELKVIGG